MINWRRLFDNLDQYIQAPIQRRGKRWVMASRIDLSGHNRKDKTVFIFKNENIFVIEQGGDTTTLINWLLKYSGQFSKPYEVFEALDGTQNINITINNYFFDSEEDIKYVDTKYRDRLIDANKYNKNALFSYLVGVFGYDSVLGAFLKYGVGCIFDTCIFWITDKNGNICHDNRIEYSDNGHRNKSKHAYRKFKTDEGFRGKGYFGYDIIDSSKKTIMVESEKSALIGSIAYPDYNWIACSGMNQIHTKSKKFILFPDYDEKAINLWRSKGEVFEWWNLFNDVSHNDDVADAVLRSVGCLPKI